MRLNKFINDSGYCSRREADRYIENRNVTINGKIASLGDQVGPTDKVRINGNLIESQTEYVYIALNKPVGISSTTDTTDRSNVVDFVNYPTRIFHIGRLDKDSEGLLLLTNNGDIVNKILRAENNHEKEYEVMVDKPITPQFIETMGRGVKILGTVTKRCKVTQEGVNRFRIVLTQGMNRQIRRMCSALGFEVTRLKRVRIMHIKLAPLTTGNWRYLTDEELEVLFENIKESDGTSQKKSSVKKSSTSSTSHKSSPSTGGKPSNSKHSGNKQFGSKTASQRPSSSRGRGGRDVPGGGSRATTSRPSNKRSGRR